VNVMWIFPHMLENIIYGFISGRFSYPIILNILVSVAWLLISYLVGSLPVAWLLAKWITHHDLRTLGSGNVGVMNTAISVARWAGLLTFLAEIAKGILVVFLARRFGTGAWELGLSIIGVVMGTRWPVWLKFKGGRGNTAGFTALLLVSYPAPIISLSIWSLARMLFKTSYPATRITIYSLPLVLWLSTHSWYLTLTGVTLALIYLHAQQYESDDHLLIKKDYNSLLNFLVSPRRHK
jgi:acyl phosphate:glycerol-3-phosphate acyltransferase